MKTSTRLLLMLGMAFLLISFFDQAFAEANRFSLRLSSPLILTLLCFFLLQYWINWRLIFSPLTATPGKALQMDMKEGQRGEEIPLPKGNALEEHAPDAERESEELLRQLMEHIDDVMWVMSTETRHIVYINQACEKVWGRSRQNLYSHTGSWLESVYPDDRERVARAYRERFEQGFQEEYRVVTADGSLRWVRTRTFPIRNSSGIVYRLAGIAQDITEEKRLRQESEYRLQQVIQADKLASLGEMVAGVAHEINNPNSFITYNVPLLAETWEIFEPILQEFASAHPEWRKGRLSLDDLCRDMEEIIEAIKTGSDRINRVVSNLKDFARLDESAHTRPVRINEVIEKTMLIVGSQLKRSGAKVDVRLAPGVPEINGHFQKLEQVVANLLLNATHAINQQNKAKISLSTRFVDRLDTILVEVEDNGMGIAQDALQRLFDPFFTTRRSSGGTGLGLSVSYGLVREHGGTIGVLSRPGLGSRFTVYLPRDTTSPLELSPTILCVDDNKPFLDMLSMQFLRVRKLLKVLSDPRSVLAHLEEYPEMDIVLCDLLMPNMDGWELLTRIKARFPLLPVILYSGDPGALERKPDGAPTPDILLEKPFAMKQLIDIINTIGRQRL